MNSSSLRRLLVSLTLSLALSVCAGPVPAHTDSPGSPPLVPEAVRLKYRTPVEIVALFSRERLPAATGDRIPRAARVDEAESLVPYGVDAVLRSGEPDQVVLVGTEGVSDVRDCIRVLDAPIEKTGADRARIVLMLRRAEGPRVRALLDRLPKAGSVTLVG